MAFVLYDLRSIEDDPSFARNSVPGHNWVIVKHIYVIITLEGSHKNGKAVGMWMTDDIRG